MDHWSSLTNPTFNPGAVPDSKKTDVVSNLFDIYYIKVIFFAVIYIYLYLLYIYIYWISMYMNIIYIHVTCTTTEHQKRTLETFAWGGSFSIFASTCEIHECQGCRETPLIIHVRGLRGYPQKWVVYPVTSMYSISSKRIKKRKKRNCSTLRIGRFKRIRNLPTIQVKRPNCSLEGEGVQYIYAADIMLENLLWVDTHWQHPWTMGKFLTRGFFSGKYA